MSTSPAPGSPGAPAATCAGCGTEVAPSLLSCPVCHRLVHAARLRELAGEADQAAAGGDPARALALWRDAMLLLPPGSTQYSAVSARAAALSREVEATPSQRPSWAKRAGPLGVLALLLWKSKALVVFALTKGKLLLAGLGQGTTLLTMLASFAVYWTAWGWRFAAGLVLSIYVHEMGHVAALRRFGIPASAPMFLPGIGAVVRLRHMLASPVEDARVGLAGPWWGLWAAVAAVVLHATTHAPVWAALAHAGAWINLFNLLPISPLDGGRGFNALSRGQRWAAAIVLAALWALTREGMLVLLLIGAVLRGLSPRAPHEGDRTAFTHYVLLAAALAVLAGVRPPA